MPFILKKREPDKLSLTICGQTLTLLLVELPATVLFELAQMFQQARSERAREDGRAVIPAAFARMVVDAVVEAACSWEDVLDEKSEPLRFSRDRLRALLESDVAVIPQLITYVAKLFTRSQLEQQQIEEEEKN